MLIIKLMEILFVCTYVYNVITVQIHSWLKVMKTLKKQILDLFKLKTQSL